MTACDVDEWDEVDEVSRRGHDSPDRSDADGERGRPSQDAPSDLVAGDLAVHLGRLARDLENSGGTTATLDMVVATTVADVPGADHVSVSVVDRHLGGRTVAATSDIARLVDALQYREQQGPCLDTLFDHVTVRSGDLGTEPRWPRFGMAAAAAGVASVLSVQLFTDGRNLGALNLFGDRQDAFDDDAERIALALAAQASVAMARSEQIEGLLRAVESRDVIGQAKGILMERYKIDSGIAFGVLVRYSRDNNIKLVEVARSVVDGAPSSDTADSRCASGVLRPSRRPRSRDCTSRPHTTAGRRPAGRRTEREVTHDEAGADPADVDFGDDERLFGDRRWRAAGSTSCRSSSRSSPAARTWTWARTVRWSSSTVVSTASGGRSAS